MFINITYAILQYVALLLLLVETYATSSMDLNMYLDT